MSYMVNKNNPDIYISAIWAKKSAVPGLFEVVLCLLMGICLMVVPLAVPNSGTFSVSGYRGSVLWLYPCQWPSGICLMVVPLVVPKQKT